MKLFLPAIRLFVAFFIITGIFYPLGITAFSQLAYNHQANGSIIKKNGTDIGSELVEEEFTSPAYFHGRPSAANYDASGSTGSNYGPSNKKLVENVKKNVTTVKSENNLPENASIPADLVLASGSGLDPHISPEGAKIQIQRVATARNLPVKELEKLVEKSIEQPTLGILGEPRVNVLLLNISIDQQFGKPQV
ncbi:MAG: potassium-transporting ATPase subunit KdpC [bacterium]